MKAPPRKKKSTTYKDEGVCVFMVFNATFNNTSVISYYI